MLIVHVHISVIHAYYELSMSATLAAFCPEFCCKLLKYISA